MNKAKKVVTRDADELARALDLLPAEATEMRLRRRMNDKIIDAVKKSGLTQAQVAKAARTSRTRLNAILNRNTAQISTDLMLRILAALGYEAKITFTRSHRAA